MLYIFLLTIGVQCLCAMDYEELSLDDFANVSSAEISYEDFIPSYNSPRDFEYNTQDHDIIWSPRISESEGNLSSLAFIDSSSSFSSNSPRDFEYNAKDHDIIWSPRISESQGSFLSLENHFPHLIEGPSLCSGALKRERSNSFQNIQDLESQNYDRKRVRLSYNSLQISNSTASCVNSLNSIQTMQTRLETFQNTVMNELDRSQGNTRFDRIKTIFNDINESQKVSQKEFVSYFFSSPENLFLQIQRLAIIFLKERDFLNKSARFKKFKGDVTTLLCIYLKIVDPIYSNIDCIDDCTKNSVQIMKSVYNVKQHFSTISYKDIVFGKLMFEKVLIFLLNLKKQLKISHSIFDDLSRGSFFTPLIYGMVPVYLIPYFAILKDCSYEDMEDLLSKNHLIYNNDSLLKSNVLALGSNERGSNDVHFVNFLNYSLAIKYLAQDFSHKVGLFNHDEADFNFINLVSYTLKYPHAFYKNVTELMNYFEFSSIFNQAYSDSVNLLRCNVSQFTVDQRSSIFLNFCEFLFYPKFKEGLFSVKSLYPTVYKLGVCEITPEDVSNYYQCNGMISNTFHLFYNVLKSKNQMFDINS